MNELGERVAGVRRFLAGWRTRIVVSFTVAVVVLGVVLFAAMLFRLNRQLDDRVDDRLAQEVEELRELASTSGSDGGPAISDVADLFETYLRSNVPDEDEYQFTILDGEPFLRAGSSPAYRLDADPAVWSRWVGLESPDRGDVDTPGGHVEFLAVPVDVDGRTGVFVTAIFDDVERDLLSDAVTRTASTVGLAGIAATIVLALWLSARLTRPVAQMATTAREVGERRLGDRIDVRGRDELADLARTFNAMLDRLEDAFGSQRRLLADVGHELRTPITVVRGHIELLDVGDPADRRATVELVTGELDRMERLVADLLTIAQAERPDFLDPAEVDIEEIPAAVVARMRPVAPARRWHIAQPQPVRAIADEGRLVQALVALADNAIVHTPPEGDVEVGAGIEEGDVVLWVADRGPGIPEDRRDELVERFARGGSSSGRRGTGLGLAIASSVATAHGGRLVIGDNPGGGARIELRLPPGGPGREETSWTGY